MKSFCLCSTTEGIFLRNLYPSRRRTSLPPGEVSYNHFNASVSAPLNSNCPFLLSDNKYPPARHHAPHILHLHIDETVPVRATRHRGPAGKGLVPVGRQDGADRQGAQARGRQTRAESDGKTLGRVGEAAGQLNRQVANSARYSIEAADRPTLLIKLLPSIPGDLVRRLDDIGRRDAVLALTNGCPLYRIKPSRAQD